MILYATYSGNLMASLATEQIKLPFSTLEGLANQDEYTLIVYKGTVHELLFKVNTYVIRRTHSGIQHVEL